MSSDRIVGCVNWFDSKKGFGFVTVLTPELDQTGNDLFIHFSNIQVEDDYKRVYPGEYIEFELGQSPDGRPCCTSVTGLYGGNLLTQNKDHKYKIFPKNRRENEENNSEENEEENDNPEQ
tara:strand:- start:445 stop:804 length:360 start_codon:yes stop_codon:yes gene_type:complete